MVGTTWQVIANLAQADKAPVKAVVPKEGSTGWSDTWMVAAKAEHPNCAYKWMDWIVSPEGERRRWPSGSARRRPTARPARETADKNFCTTFHAADETYSDQVWYWTTPTSSAWTAAGTYVQRLRDVDQAWTEIKG